MNAFFSFKLVVSLLTAIFLISPKSLDRGPSPQQKAEKMVQSFLSEFPPYMPIYFSDIDTAYMLLEDNAEYKQLTRRVQLYQDSTVLFSRSDIAKADSFYSLYKKLNLKKDSMRIHYEPQPLGWLIIHHFQLEGRPWTDSFMIDFGFTKIVKVKQTIE